MKEQLIQLAVAFVMIFSGIYRWAIIAYIVVSWLPNVNQKIRGILNQIVRPVLRPFEFAQISGLSFSAILALIVIDFLSAKIIYFLYNQL